MTEEVISQKSLAAELRASPSSISQLVARGMPRRDDGRLNRTESLQWITKNCVGSYGGWSAGMRGKPSLAERAQMSLGGGNRQEQPLSPDLAGAATVALRLCANIRESLPGLLADLRVSPEWPRTGQLLVLKCDMLALVDLLLRGWVEEIFKALNDAGYDIELPEVDFSPFGKHADSARAMFTAMQQYWQTGDTGEGTITIPDDEPGDEPKPRKARARARK